MQIAVFLLISAPIIGAVVYGVINILKQINKIEETSSAGSYEDLAKYRRGRSKH
jgi:hypothetical protein